jgi:hypothetical protein
MQVQRVFKIVLASLVMCGCYKQRVVTTPQIYLSAQQPGRIDLVRVDGSQSMVYAPRLVNDTIYGMTGMSQSCMLSRCMGQEVTISLSQVQSFKVRELDKARTYALLGAGAVGVVAAAAALSGKGPDMGCVGLCGTNMQTRTGVSLSSSSVTALLTTLLRQH